MTEPLAKCAWCKTTCTDDRDGLWLDPSERMGDVWFCSGPCLTKWEDAP